MFERMLAAVDESARAEQVMRMGRALAQDSGGALIVLRVRPDPPVLDRVTNGDVALAEQTGALRAAGIAAHYLVHAGSPERQIIETARQQRSTLIIIAARENGPHLAPRRRMTDRLAARAPAPLLVIPEDNSQASVASTDVDGTEFFGPDGAPVLVALDGSPLAERALPYAAELAARLGRPLALLRVASPLRSQEQLAEAWSYVESARRRVRERISRDLSIDAQVVVGAPIDELLWAVEGRRACAIVLTARGQHEGRPQRASAITLDVVRKLRIPALIIPSPVLASDPQVELQPAKGLGDRAP
ncbi:MAG TPA: universal stress protein [Ktedonobacterales bacterium]|jgi:nucleotide-binding universal stress UspA family protein|nr:universal stress protein [Ktedonobacterales bacterium]